MPTETCQILLIIRKYWIRWQPLPNELVRTFSDWVRQLPDQAISDCPRETGYLDLARQSAQSFPAKAEEFETTLKQEYIHGTKSRPLNSYTATHYNASRDFLLDLCRQSGELAPCFQSRRSQSYQLSHYHNDGSPRCISRAEQLKRAGWDIT